MSVQTHSSSVGLRKARAEAAAWVVKLHGPDRSPELEAAFRDWLSADGENQRQFERVTTVWDDARGIPMGGVPRVALAEWSRNPTRRWLAAAVLLLALGIGGLSTYRIWYADVYWTHVGEQRIVRLEDGSRVSLNSDTELRVQFSTAERHLVLIKGEAYFEVAHSTKWPFVVSSGGHDVTAVGTMFLVRHDPGGTAVTLVEGKITVSNAVLSPAGNAAPQSSPPSECSGATATRSPALGPRNAHGLAGAVRPVTDSSGVAGAAQLVTLTPGERLMFNTGSAPKLDSPPLDTVTAWRRGEVVLDNTTLNDAVAEMNRYEDHKLVIGSSEIGNLRISGIYHIGDSSGFARTVAKIYRLRMDEAQNKIYLNGKPSTD